MTTKEYLRQIAHLDNSINDKLSEAGQMRELAMNISSVFREVVVQTSGCADKVGSAVARIVDLEAEIDAMIDKRVEIIGQVERLPNKISSEILTARYVQNKDLKLIAYEREISLRHLIRLYKTALREFEAEYGQEYLGKHFKCH